MKRSIAILIVVAGAISSACIPSLHPFYTEADIYYDRNLLGTWIDSEGKESWTFVGSASRKDYRMTYVDESGKKGVFEARLFKIDGQSFLDVAPVRPAFKENDYYTAHLLSVHTVVRLSLNERNAEMASIDPDWLKKTLEADPTQLQHTIIEGDVYLTDTTPKIQKFISANLNTAGAFMKSASIRRKEAKR